MQSVDKGMLVFAVITSDACMLLCFALSNAKGSRERRGSVHVGVVRIASER
jgi:hypothetical protein